MASTTTTTTSPSTSHPDSGKTNFPTDSSLPGEYFEVRQTHPTGDYTPDPSKSIPLSPARQALVEDIVALYEMKPTIERVKRYTPDCVYNDQFVYANDRYKMAGQWFALPKLFKGAKSHGWQVVTNDRDLIQFRHEEVRFFLLGYGEFDRFFWFWVLGIGTGTGTDLTTGMDLQSHPKDSRRERHREPIAGPRFHR